MVGPGRLELPTPRLSSVCSNQLSYEPFFRCVPSRVPQPQMINLADPIQGKKRYAGNSICAFVRKAPDNILRKEVIQPQVPLRLPCYDLVPVADPTVVACLLAVSVAPSGRTNSHDLTGGVYKTRERIHRNMLICDY